MTVAIVLNAPNITVEITETAVLCADGGFRHLKNVKPLAVVGDFDSLDFNSLPEGTVTVTHPVEKNQTDGELALRYAQSLGATDVVFYGMLGGRLEHVLCNLALLKLANSLDINAFAREEGLSIFYATGKCAFETYVGDGVSILPYGGAAVVTDSKGLYYPLSELTLTSEDTRGVSNEATAEKVRFNVIKGGCLVFHYAMNFDKRYNYEI
jgi:thiamine pyrophosphokinase